MLTCRRRQHIRTLRMGSGSRPGSDLFWEALLSSSVFTWRQKQSDSLDLLPRDDVLVQLNQCVLFSVAPLLNFSIFVCENSNSLNK